MQQAPSHTPIPGEDAISGHTTVKIGDVALLRGARGCVNFGVNNATSPVTLNHKRCFLVYLQVLLLEQTQGNVIRMYHAAQCAPEL